MSKKIKVKLEERVGKVIGGYEVLGVDRTNTRRPKLIVCCPICKKDPEINGDAIYLADCFHIEDGNKVCECGINPKRSLDVWTKILRRKSSEAGQEFLGYAEVWRGNVTYLRLRCKVCGHEHEKCNVANYLRDRECPLCAINIRAEARVKSDSTMISSFLKTGVFSQGTTFQRIGGAGRRRWSVVCGECSDEYTADRSNLQAGKRSCSCSAGGGIDVKLPVYFYVLYVAGESRNFIGFGITNFPERRMYLHDKELEKHDLSFSIVKFVKFFEGKLALEMESRIKRELQIEDQGIDGFKREAVATKDLHKVMSYMERDSALWVDYEDSYAIELREVHWVKDNHGNL